MASPFSCSIIWKKLLQKHPSVYWKLSGAIQQEVLQQVKGNVLILRVLFFIEALLAHKQQE